MDLVAIGIEQSVVGPLRQWPGSSSRRHRPGSLSIRFSAGVPGVLPVTRCGWGMGQNWSTMAASAVVVLVGAALDRQYWVPPVILISGVLPLGAAKAMFNAILELMRVASLEGEPLVAASVALSASMAKAFTTSLAIAMVLAAGMAVVRVIRRERCGREPDPHLSPASAARPDLAALASCVPCQWTPGARPRSLSEKSEGPRYGRRGARCKASRRRRCGFIGEARQRRRWPHAARHPKGAGGLPGACGVARRPRCPTSRASSRLACTRQAPCARTFPFLRQAPRTGSVRGAGTGCAVPAEPSLFSRRPQRSSVPMSTLGIGDHSEVEDQTVRPVVGVAGLLLQVGSVTWPQMNELRRSFIVSPNQLWVPQTCS